MNHETTRALESIRGVILTEAERKDGYAMGEVLSGNTVKEQAYRSAAAGLRMAAAIISERLASERMRNPGPY